jgi:hypothetical protein
VLLLSLCVLKVIIALLVPIRQAFHALKEIYAHKVLRLRFLAHQVTYAMELEIQTPQKQIALKVHIALEAQLLRLQLNVLAVITVH